MFKNYKVFLFDFDGTLVNSYFAMIDIFTQSYKAAGIDIDPSIIKHLMRVRLPQGYAELNGKPENYEIFCKTILKTLNSDESVKSTTTYVDVNSTLNKLKEEGKVLGIVTSNNLKHVRDILCNVGIDENLFSIFIGNEEVKNHKPAPDPILKAVELLGVSKEETCYVGDAMDDITSSNAAGVTPILLDRDHEYNEYSGEKIYSLDELL